MLGHTALASFPHIQQGNVCGCSQIFPPMATSTLHPKSERRHFLVPFIDKRELVNWSCFLSYIYIYISHSRYCIQSAIPNNSLTAAKSATVLC